MGRSKKKEHVFDPSAVKVFDFDNIDPRIFKIIEELKTADYFAGDLSDIGNTIGIIMGKYICEDWGFEEETFMHGFNHGVSLSNKTHP